MGVVGSNKKYWQKEITAPNTIMDDSDLDFSDLCSRLLKRKVRKKTGEERKTGDGDKSSRSARSGPRQTKKTTNQLKTKKETSSEPVGKVESEPRAALSVSQLTENGIERPTETQLEATQKRKGEMKEKVLSRMQRFKRVDPQKLQHAKSSPSTSTEPPCFRHPSFPEQNKELSLDERLALRLQQELDKEYETQQQQQERRVLDVDQESLFFCQLCFRDLSAMTPQLRTQHINRCLDQSENQSAPVPPQPVIPECPICGKGFKSLKSRSTHLKRCSTDMGVPPAVLLQALQRQATEAVSDGTAGQSAQAGGSKRRNPSDPSQPVRKRSKKKAQPMDEDTMVAVALSRSLLDQEVEMERAKVIEVVEVKGAEPQMSVGTTLQWKTAGAGKGKRRRKGAPAAPPPLLLRQDPEEALRRLQERVSLMLLRSRTPSPPPTPMLAPSALLLPQAQRIPSCGGREEGETPDSWPPAPLWHKSALPAGCGHATADFYTPELSAFIQPYSSIQREVPSTATAPSQLPPAAAEPITQVQPQPQPCSPSPVASTPTSLLPSQAVQDLLELGEKGLNLATAGPHPGRSHADAPELSGRANSDSETHVEPNNSLCLSRLTSDLSSMVNNPQLSDVQFQVDSGEVFFAHSFMLYARCPLLVKEVHASGFGVQEEGMPAAQRVLLGEVPAGAVLCLLQFLYTAQCKLIPGMAPYVQELASRFDVPELQQECQRYLQRLEQEGSEAWKGTPAQEPVEASEEQDDTLAQLNFLELLRSMWSSDDEEGVGEVRQEEGRGDRVDRSIRIEEQGGEGEENGGEENVDEEELEEIYEFAATQRKGRESALMHEMESLEEEDKEEEEEQNENCETAQDQVRILFEMEEGKSCKHQVGEENEEEGLIVGKKETPTGRGNCLTSSHLTESSSSSQKAGSVTVMDAHKTAMKVNQYSDQLHQADPALPTDCNLDDSFNHLFSQSWGEYAEPSPIQDTSRHQSMSKANLVQVIDLSISPPPPTCEPYLPVPGLSPELTITGGSQVLRISSEMTPAKGGQMSPELTITQGSQRLKLSLKARERQGSQLEARTSNSQTQGSCTEQHSREVELIVLSDSSDESPTCLSPSSPQPICPKSPLLDPEDSPGYTCIKDTEKNSLSSSKIEEPLRDSCGSQTPVANPSAKANPCPSNPADQSFLDGSAEVSWLVPSTPHISTRTRSNSTQTESSIRRTRLFSACSLSQSSPSSSSEALGLSKAPSENGISCKEESEEVSVSNQTSTVSQETQTKLKGSRLNVTLDSPVFIPPKSLPRWSSSTTDLTPCDSHRGTSVDKRSKRFGQPVSSTPLHSGIESSLNSHLLAESPFSSQVEKNQPVQNSGTAPRGSLASEGSPKRKGSLGLSHLNNGVSPSRDQGAAHIGMFSSRQQAAHEGSDTGSSKSPEWVSEHRTIWAEKIDMNRVEDNIEREINETGKEKELSAQQSFSNFDEPPMPFDEPPMAYEDDPPMAIEHQSIACDEPPNAFDEPPMAFDDSWGFGDHRPDLQKPRFSLRLESSGDATNLNCTSATSPLQPQVSQSSLQAQAIAPDKTPPTLSPKPQSSTSVLDPQLWDSWEEDEEVGGSARPLAQRLGAVAPAKRVTQLRTPVASKKTGPLVPITPMPHYSDMDTPELKNKLNRFGVRPLPKKQMVQKLKEIFQYTHQLETSESEDEALVQGHRPRPVSPPARSCAQSLKFKEPMGPPAVSPRKVQPSLDAKGPLSLSQSSNASSASQDSERSNPELALSDSDSSSDNEVTASQAASRVADNLRAVQRFILSDPELHSQVLLYRPLVLSHLQERLKVAGIRVGAAKLLDFLDAQCITFTTAKPGQKAPTRRKKKKKMGVRVAAEGGAKGRVRRAKTGATAGPD